MTIDAQGAPNPASRAYTCVQANSPSTYAAFITGDFPFVSGSTSEITIGAWVRIGDPTAHNGIVLNDSDTLWIDISVEGTSPQQLVVRVGNGRSGQPIVYSVKSPFADGGWHFLFFAMSAGPQGTQLTLVVDGIALLNVDEPSFGTTLTATQFHVGNGGTQLVSFSMWSKALPIQSLAVPQFGPPQPQSIDFEDLLCAFDFASGPAHDASGHDVTVNSHAGPTFMPRLALQEGSHLNPAPADNLALFGTSFAVMATLAPPTGANGKLLLFSAATLGLSITNTGSVSAAGLTEFDISFGSQSSTIELAAGAPMHVTANVEVVGDSTTATVFVNGVQMPGGGLTVPSVAAEVPVFASTTGTTGWILGLSVWNRAVTNAEIAADMHGTDPTGSDGLVSSWALQHDLKNSVTAQEAAPVNAGIVDVVETAETVTALATALAAMPRDAEPEADLIRFVQPSDYETLAQRHGLDGAALAAVSLSPVHAQMLDDVTALAPDDAHPLAALRDQAQRHLRIAAALDAKGIKTGQTEMVRKDDAFVFYYHDMSGPHEIYRMDAAAGDTAALVVQVIIDVIGILGSIFGLYTTADRTKKVLRVLAVLATEIRSAIDQVVNAAPNGKPGAGSVISAVVATVFTFGLGWPVVKALVTGSWWSLIFTVISIIGQIVLAIASDGVALLIKIALLGIATLKLLADVAKLAESAKEPA